MNRAPRTDVLVTGGTGLLGSALVRALATGVPPPAVVATWHRTPPPPNQGAAWEALELEDGDGTARLVARLAPRVVVHTAVAVREEDFARGIVLASARLARACHANGAALVHVSSDMVFDGAHGPFDEDAAPSPITPYGAAKARAEARVRAEHPGAYVVRSSLLYALDPPDRSLAAWLAGLDAGTAFPLFEDEIRCPAPAGDVAAAVARLARALCGDGDGKGDGEHAPPAQHTLHLVGPEPIDRHTLGTLVLAALGRDAARAPSARLADSGLVRPRELVLTRARTPAWLVEGIRPPRQALVPAHGAPGRAAAPTADRS